MKIRKYVNKKTQEIYLTTSEPEIDDMVGITFTKVYKNEENDAVVFECKYGQFIFDHQQSCCENVYIESIVGDLQDLVDTPLLIAEEVISNNEQAYESGTWTFYKFATNKGYVDVRWLGESNGYYSESVDLRFIALPGVVLEEVFNVSIETI